MEATIQKWGNSQGLRLPKFLLDSLNIRESDKVELELEGNSIVIRPIPTQKHRTLEERLTDFYESDEFPRISSEEISWGESQGSEL